MRSASVRYPRRGAVKEAVETALEAFDGVIDVIVNNAGMAALDTSTGCVRNVMNAVIDTNLKGAMLRHQVRRATT